ncbi:MAG TPA: G1 family glutamic endopeptidase, partial [Streptosporangiaceae bacterium]
MIRRWSIPLTTAGLVLGSLLALGGTASAATAHPAAGHGGPPASVAGFQPGGLMQRPGGASASAAARARGANAAETSTNWSGYAVTGANGAFRSVSASWKEPTASCSGRSAQYAAFWVGLDGFASDSVEQTGTDSDCSGRTPEYYGWYEMFP